MDCRNYQVNKCVLCINFLIRIETVRTLYICTAHIKSSQKNLEIKNNNSALTIKQNYSSTFLSLALNTHEHEYTKEKECLAKVRLSYIFIYVYNFICVYYFVVATIILVAHFMNVCFVLACMCHENSNEME